MSVKLSGNKIARGEAECYLSLNLTRVKFVPETSRITPTMVSAHEKASFSFKHTACQSLYDTFLKVLWQ